MMLRLAAILVAWACFGGALYMWSAWSLLLGGAGLAVYILTLSVENENK